MFYGAEALADGHWVTMNGTHVLIEGGAVSAGYIGAAADKLKISAAGKAALLAKHASGKIKTDEDLYRHIDAHGKAVAAIKARGGERAPGLDASEVTVHPAGGKIVASWRDSKGRMQASYSPEAVAERDAHKFGAVKSFHDALPSVRSQVDADLGKADAQRERVTAAVVRLIDKTTMRVGSEEYARENGTYGASSLRKEHVSVNGDTVKVAFTGKHNQPWSREVKDAALAGAVSHLLSLPGERLFQSHDAAGALHPVTEATVRDYLKPHGISPKQFRTYHATRMADEALRAVPAPRNMTEARSQVTQVVKQVAAHLGNTPAMARQSYINPAVIEAHLARAGGGA